MQGGDSHAKQKNHFWGLLAFELFAHARLAFKPRQMAHAHELESRSAHEVVHQGRGSSPESDVAMSCHVVVVVVITSTQGTC